MYKHFYTACKSHLYQWYIFYLFFYTNHKAKEFFVTSLHQNQIILIYLPFDNGKKNYAIDKQLKLRPAGEIERIFHSGNRYFWKLSKMCTIYCTPGLKGLKRFNKNPILPKLFNVLKYWTIQFWDFALLALKKKRISMGTMNIAALFWINWRVQKLRSAI